MGSNEPSAELESPPEAHPPPTTSNHGSDVGVAPPKKQDLWKHAVEHRLGEGVVVQMQEAPAHVVYARVVTEEDDVTIGAVLEHMVADEWKHLAKDILEHKRHVPVDAYPSARQLLELGAVWLLNESSYTQGHGAHAHRLTSNDETTVPNWKDYTLRVHAVPDRFFAADAVDWSKPCRGLLLGSVHVTIDGKKPHVPMANGLPDEKDGVIVYEDDTLGLAVLNKPGNVPVHATVSNNKEDVAGTFSRALQDNQKRLHVSVPHNHGAALDTEASGLLAVATKSEFATYFSNLVEESEKSASETAVTKTYKCLVCVKDPDRMGLLEHFARSGNLVTHYFDPDSHHRFVRNAPEDQNWPKCQLRICQVGNDKFRAASVQSPYPNSVDSCLAHRLWGPKSTFAEEHGVQYVMELQLELIGKTHKHQIRGQLAALGFTIVGDGMYGGGHCDEHANRHVWNRMALQCCKLAFPEPEWKDNNTKKKELVRSERPCVFQLSEAWWSGYLAQYYDLCIMEAVERSTT